jgi:serine/threonine protein kinase
MMFSDTPKARGACPSAEELAGFGRGTLDESRLAEVANHLGECLPCRSRLAACDWEGDRLLAGLRELAAEGPTPAAQACEPLKTWARQLPIDRLTRDSAQAHTAEVITQLEHEEIARVGPYHLLERLGSGGFGTVYRALHVKLKRPFAVKVLSPRRMADPQTLQRFQREMEAVGRLDHVHIVRATDAGEADGYHYLAMEFVEGIDLTQLVGRLGSLAVSDACEVIRQAALGLQFAHEHGLVHRDVKPSNLLLTTDGVVKVLDLGLALLGGERPANGALTDVGQMMGTADFMAPEQAWDSHGVDIRADIYSLGCTLYKLLSGHAPFSGKEYDSARKKVMAHACLPMPAIREQRPDVPGELVAVLDRMTAKERDQRFATPAAVADVLAEFAAGSDPKTLARRALGRCASPPTPARTPDSRGEGAPQAEPPPRQAGPFVRRRRRVLLWGIPLLAATAIAGYLALRPVPVSVPSSKGTSTLPSEMGWPDDYPLSLRERPAGQRISLLTVSDAPPRHEDPARMPVQRGLAAQAANRFPRCQPLWCRLLSKEGKYAEMDQWLMLTTRQDAPPGEGAILALEDDRAHRWFEFETEMVWPYDPKLSLPCGVFFGWDEVRSGAARAFFVQLDWKPDAGGQAPNGRILVDTRVHDPARQGEDILSPTPLPGLALGGKALPQAKTSHLLSVRAEPGKVRVGVDAQTLIEFKPPFAPHGPLGIWTCGGGTSYFKKATIRSILP